MGTPTGLAFVCVLSKTHAGPDLITCFFSALQYARDLSSLGLDGIGDILQSTYFQR